jgi:hypothetical protein
MFYSIKAFFKQLTKIVNRVLCFFIRRRYKRCDFFLLSSKNDNSDLISYFRLINQNQLFCSVFKEDIKHYDFYSNKSMVLIKQKSKSSHLLWSHTLLSRLKRFTRNIRLINVLFSIDAETLYSQDTCSWMLEQLLLLQEIIHKKINICIILKHFKLLQGILILKKYLKNDSVSLLPTFNIQYKKDNANLINDFNQRYDKWLDSIVYRCWLVQEHLNTKEMHVLLTLPNLLALIKAKINTLMMKLLSGASETYHIKNIFVLGESNSSIEPLSLRINSLKKYIQQPLLNYFIHKQKRKNFYQLLLCLILSIVLLLFINAYMRFIDLYRIRYKNLDIKLSGNFLECVEHLNKIPIISRITFPYISLQLSHLLFQFRFIYVRYIFLRKITHQLENALNNTNIPIGNRYIYFNAYLALAKKYNRAVLEKKSILYFLANARYALK